MALLGQRRAACLGSSIERAVDRFTSSRALRSACCSPCSVMQECKAARGLEQLAELMAQGKLKVHFDR